MKYLVEGCKISLVNVPENRIGRQRNDKCKKTRGMQEEQYSTNVNSRENSEEESIKQYKMFLELKDMIFPIERAQ